MLVTRYQWKEKFLIQDQKRELQDEYSSVQFLKLEKGLGFYIYSITCKTIILYVKLIRLSNGAHNILQYLGIGVKYGGFYLHLQPL